MGQLGMGAMLHLLGGGSDVAPEELIGQKVEAAELQRGGSGEDRLLLTLAGGGRFAIWDAGRSCCEARYITTDDDAASLVGGVLRKIEARLGASVEAEYEEHETCFVEVATDKGFITLTTHNEHNGYYGGFGLTITRVED